MGGTVETGVVRSIKPGEARLFAAWEKAGRPYPWAEESFPETTWVYEVRGVPRAYAVVRVAAGEAYLSNMMVDPAHRRSGIGADFLQKVMIRAASSAAECMALDVDTANLPAIGLYKKLGFETVQLRERSYPNGEHAFVMRRQL